MVIVRLWDVLFSCVRVRIRVRVGGASGHGCRRSVVVVVCVVSGLVVGVSSVSEVVCAPGGRSVHGRSIEVAEFLCSALV